MVKLALLTSVIACRYVPLRLKAWFTSTGITNVIEMDWWDEIRHNSTDVVITMTPAQVSPVSPLHPAMSCIVSASAKALACARSALSRDKSVLHCAALEQ